MPDPERACEGVGGVLLVAGEGSRFAGPAHKLATEFRGRPLAAWAAGAMAQAGLDGCCAVTGAAELEPILEALGVEVVRNPRWAEGQATSLRAGLDWCDAQGFRAAVVGLGDQPLVPASAWRTVAASGSAPVVTATYGGRRSPPVRLDRSIWGLLPAEGDEGARALMRRRPELVGEVACEGDPADVDTCADLRRHDEVRTWS